MTTPATVGGPATRDLTRGLLSVVTTLLLLVSCLWVLRPFAGGLVWATMIVVTTWPLLLRVQRGFGGRRWAAVLVMTLALVAVFVVPLLVAVGTFVANLDKMTAWVQATIAAGIPGPPSWAERVPLVGAKIASRWAELAATSPEELREGLAPYRASIVRWLASTVGTVGGTLVHLLLMVVLSTVLYTTGETAASGAVRLARRLGGESGEGAVRLAGQAVRAVALGVVGTAIIQAALAGLGLFVSGVPFAGALTAVIFVTCIAQLGPIPILAPCVGWLYWSGNPGWGTALLVWTLFVGTIDNVIRPFLIKRGADLSLLLIFAGVIGGLIAFGVVGLFVGPVLLAVTYTLGAAWVRSGEA
jgi:predicted PurR-regulated permease PerM